jgi:hypothetical protein
MNDKRQRPVNHSWLISLLNWLKNGAEKSTKYDLMLIDSTFSTDGAGDLEVVLRMILPEIEFYLLH